MLRRKPIQTYDFFLYQNQISNNYLLTIIRYFSQVLLNIIQYMRHVLRPTLYMMTSSNGNIFRVTGPLRVEFTDHRWIPFTKASDAELWCFFSCAWINSWVNNREAGNLSRHRTHYDIIVMTKEFFCKQNTISNNNIFIPLTTAIMVYQRSDRPHIFPSMNRSLFTLSWGFRGGGYSNSVRQILCKQTFRSRKRTSHIF